MGKEEQKGGTKSSSGVEVPVGTLLKHRPVRKDTGLRMDVETWNRVKETAAEKNLSAAQFMTDAIAAVLDGTMYPQEVVLEAVKDLADTLAKTWGFQPSVVRGLVLDLFRERLGVKEKIDAGKGYSD